MESGVSWSGHERNVAWLQAGSGAFVDASSISGLDQADDGRVALRCDWDGDGDLDLWLRFRSGPTLRFLENHSDPERHLVFEPGRPGASMVVETTLAGIPGQTLLQTRSADGYLAGVRPRVTLALRPGEQVLGEVVQVEGERRVRSLEESRARVVERSPSRASLAEGALPIAPLPGRVVLRTPLPLPAERLESLGFEPGRPHVVVVEDPECAVCREVLPAALSAIGQDVRLGLSRVNTGNQEDRAAVQWASITAAHILGPAAELDTPLSLLVDPAGRLQALRVGTLGYGRLSQDVGQLALKPIQGAFRSTFDPPGASRWFHGMPRIRVKLAQDLRAAGFVPEADFYSK